MKGENQLKVHEFLELSLLNKFISSPWFLRDLGWGLTLKLTQAGRSKSFGGSRDEERFEVANVVHGPLCELPRFPNGQGLVRQLGPEIFKRGSQGARFVFLAGPRIAS